MRTSLRSVQSVPTLSSLSARLAHRTRRPSSALLTSCQWRFFPRTVLSMRRSWRYILLLCGGSTPTSTSRVRLLIRSLLCDVTEAINRSISNGVMFVCAASNDESSSQHPISFPASLGNVFCVGSHSSKGTRSTFSSAGREIDFLAPGEGICSSVPLRAGQLNDWNGLKSGTFMATLSVCRGAGGDSPAVCARLCVALASLSSGEACHSADVHRERGHHAKKQDMAALCLRSCSTFHRLT